MADMTDLSAVQLLSSPWAATFAHFVASAREELLIASPFISAMPIQTIMADIKNRNPPRAVRVHLITNLSADSLLGGSLDVTSLANLVETIPGVTVTYLPSLHAKVYVADTETAVITSANLTYGGLIRNHEYGVVLRDLTLVRQVRTDITKYAALGSQFAADGLRAIAQTAEELKALQRDIDTSASTKLRAILREQIEQTKQKLLAVRVRGKTRNGIFCDTILYLLDRHGPLTTQSLHPLVQQIHPDLCDDTIDRVIDGVHYGKKWKHYVRDAQQTLKARGAINSDGSRWFRTDTREM